LVCERGPSGRVAIIAEVTDRGAADTTLQPAGGKNLREFSNRLAELPRRCDYKTVPIIADKPDLWDKAALAKIAGGIITNNTLIVVPAAASHDSADIDRRRVFAQGQQRRGSAAALGADGWCRADAD
jgi:hypothetical protein